MTRVMIVDDEYIIRLGLASLLDWEQYGYSICGTAADGADALSKIAELKPDIILADILMQPMDGLQLQEICAREYPQIRFIMLSNSNDFHYVRRALQFGACDYIFKLEITKEDLLRALDSAGVKKKRSAEHEDTFYLKHKLLDGLLSGENPDSEHIQPILEVLNTQPEFTAYRIASFNFVNSSHKNTSVFASRHAAQNILEQFLGLDPGSVCMWWKELKFIVFLGDDASLPQSMQDIFNRVSAYARRYLNCQTLCALSGTFHGYRAFPNAVEETEREFYEHFYTPGCFFFCNLVQYEMQYDRQLVRSVTGRLSAGIIQRSNPAWESGLDQLFAKLTTKRYLPEVSKTIVTTILENTCTNVSQTISAVVDEISPLTTAAYDELQSAPTLDILKQRSYAVLEKLFASAEQATSSREVQIAREYIAEHIESKITLTDVAQKVNLSESYFSHLFKKETGIRFVDYVNELKIEKAKALLSLSSYKVNEIAAMLGFDNPNYFNILFKRITGVAPGNYRANTKTK